MQGTELTQKQMAHALQPAFKFFVRELTVEKARLQPLAQQLTSL